MSNKKKTDLVSATATASAAIAEAEIPAPVRQEMIEATPGPTAAAPGAAAGCDDMMRVGRESAAAAAKAGVGLANGWQDFNRAMLNLTQGHFEDMLLAAKALTGARSFHEIIEIQMTLVKSSLEKLNAESSRLAEAAMRVAEDTAGPMGAGLVRFSQGATGGKS